MDDSEPEQIEHWSGSIGLEERSAVWFLLSRMEADVSGLEGNVNGVFCLINIGLFR